MAMPRDWLMILEVTLYLQIGSTPCSFTSFIFVQKATSKACARSPSVQWKHAKHDQTSIDRHWLPRLWPSWRQDDSHKLCPRCDRIGSLVIWHICMTLHVFDILLSLHLMSRRSFGIEFHWTSQFSFVIVEMMDTIGCSYKPTRLEKNIVVLLDTFQKYMMNERCPSKFRANSIPQLGQEESINHWRETTHHSRRHTHTEMKWSTRTQSKDPSLCLQYIMLTLLSASRLPGIWLASIKVEVVDVSRRSNPSRPRFHQPLPLQFSYAKWREPQCSIPEKEECSTAWRSTLLSEGLFPMQAHTRFPSLALPPSIVVDDGRVCGGSKAGSSRKQMPQALGR